MFMTACWNRGDNFKKELICVDPPSRCLIHLSCCCHENLPTQGVALKYSWGKTRIVLVIPRLNSSKFCHTALPQINEKFKSILRGKIVNKPCILSWLFN